MENRRDPESVQSAGPENAEKRPHADRPRRRRRRSPRENGDDKQNLQKNGRGEAEGNETSAENRKRSEGGSEERSGRSRRERGRFRREDRAEKNAKDEQNEKRDRSEKRSGERSEKNGEREKRPSRGNNERGERRERPNRGENDRNREGGRRNRGDRRDRNRRPENEELLTAAEEVLTETPAAEEFQPVQEEVSGTQTPQIQTEEAGNTAKTAAVEAEDVEAESAEEKPSRETYRERTRAAEEPKEPEKMVRVVGVRFRNVGKVYYFDPKDFEIRSGDHVIVETARGQEYGTVALYPREVPESRVVQPLKEVVRMATPKDDAREESNRVKEREAYKVCMAKIREHELDMKLIDVEYTFDNNKVLFYFTADGRVDFRELVKDLASIFRTRIELRQIGVRDETKILGGIGICGRALCCNTYLSDFAPVSIKMAKEQNLSLNPTKISGNCGRLMCCLKNEQETYEYLNKKLPNVGETVITPDGIKGEVSSVNVLRQTVKVLVDVGEEKEMEEYPVDALKTRPKSRKKDRDNRDHRDKKDKNQNKDVEKDLEKLQD